MRYNSKSTGRASAMPVGLAAGTTAAMGCTFIFSGLLALLLTKGTVPQTMLGYWIMAILAISSVVGAKFSYHKIKHRKILVYLLSSGMYLLCLLLLTALFFDGGYEGFIPTTLIIFGSSSAALLLSARQKKGTTTPRHSNHFC